ncbi:MAG: FAD binding domain-containing protein [Vicinamibacterales bacterium]
MQTFEWIDGTSIAQAASLLSSGTGGLVVAKAGGIDLIDLMKEGIVRPSRVINLRTIPGLDGISVEPSGELRLGALVTLARLAESAEVLAHCPALADAARHAATPQVRNAATIGGNLLQRPRCWYYRSAHFHQEDRDPAAAAIAGQHQYHAIFDNGASAMVHASTPATALVAYRASVELSRGPGQSRTVALESFLLPPDARRDRDAAIEPGEILTAVIIPAAGAGTRSAYHKQTERESYDWPICDVAVILRLDGQTVADASIVMGWVGPTPRRAVEAERLLRGQAMTEDLARRAAGAAVGAATPLPKNTYKVPILETVVRRAILAAATSEQRPT